MEVLRLRAEVERLEGATQEALLQQQTKYAAEASALREQLEEEARRSRSHEIEMQALREKLDRSRLEVMQESEEAARELRSAHDRERLLLVEENQKLQAELERAAEELTSGRLQLDRARLEEEYAELRSKKEAIAHWETQISEIINWVSDEKDARGYLQVS